MSAQETTLKIVYENAGEEVQVGLSKLLAALTRFLEHLAVRPLIDRSFFEVIQTGEGKVKLERLLTACGYENDPQGFFENILGQLGKAAGAAVSDEGRYSG